jgi:glycosyltransferase involved in cell wall biosynthesis
MLASYELKNVFLLGEYNNPYPFIKNADLGINISYHEAYGLSIAETLILNIPIIATDTSGAREILEDSKYGLVVKNNIDGIYNGIKSIINDEKLYEHYKIMAEKRKNFFNEEKIIKEIEELF